MDHLLNSVPSPSAKFDQLVACRSAKLQLHAYATIVNSTEQATAFLANHQQVVAPIILANDDRSARTTASPAAGGEAARAGRIQVTAFSGDQIRLNVNVPEQAGAWLTYKDAFHENWRATIDGENATIYPADLAFKAIFVPPGHHSIQFQYRDLLNTPFLMVIFCCSLLAGIVFVGAILYLCVSGDNRDQQRIQSC